MSFEDIPVDVGVVYEGERVRGKDMYVELGGPKMEKKFELALAREEGEVEDEKVMIIGPDLKDMEEGSFHPFGIFIEVAGSQIEPDLEGVIERRIHEYVNFVEGMMHLNQRYDIWIRLNKKSFQKGFDTLEHLGKVLIRLFKSEMNIIEKIQITFITDPDEIASRYDEAVARYNARDERARGLSDADVDTFYGCSLCQSFAPTHVCTITPQRYANCGAISWFDGRAAARVDPKGPLYSIPKGDTIDEFTGEYTGVNQAYAEKSLGKVTSVALYSAFDKPHTSCGCFEAIAFVIPEVDGLGVVHRDYKGETVNGLPFSSMADSTAGGRQIPGFHGIAVEYMRSPRFLQVDGGWDRIVWVPDTIKERVYDFIPESVRDKIPTEKDVSSIDELKAFLRENNHPVAERWVEVEEEEALPAVVGAAEDYVAVPGEFTAALPGVGGGIEIIFKNAKIFAERVIIKRIGKGDKKK
ncbi:MAG: CO dehydrogenase/CO-methylating acetyl-CoA synthase complex subunit beta [Candidatus Thorarchaeota archaeon]|nr:MAG: CO dehydrogenase/CO-methylating acetyl-CoA synthase complex subunit beta [Candidatus Thorarchaeota archaeon]